MTEKWASVIPAVELGNGERFVYETDDYRILVCQIADEFYAVDLSSGDVGLPLSPRVDRVYKNL